MLLLFQISPFLWFKMEIYHTHLVLIMNFLSSDQNFNLLTWSDNPGTKLQTYLDVSICMDDKCGIFLKGGWVPGICVSFCEQVISIVSQELP